MKRKKRVNQEVKKQEKAPMRIEPGLANIPRVQKGSLTPATPTTPATPATPSRHTKEEVCFIILYAMPLKRFLFHGLKIV